MCPARSRSGTASSRRRGTPGPDFDADDWWYRTHVRRPGDGAGWRHCALLRRPRDARRGVAQRHAARRASDNMFVARTRRRRRAAARRATSCCIRFARSTPALAQKRPRPRWKTGARRTSRTCAGSAPRCSAAFPAGRPPSPPVGPWATDRGSEPRATRVDGARASIASTRERATVAFAVRAHGRASRRQPTRRGRACASATRRAIARVVAEARRSASHGRSRVAERAALVAAHPRRASRSCPVHARARRGGDWFASTAAASASARSSVDRAERRRPSSLVNGVPVFCRGACWTPLDIVALAREPRGQLRRALELARDAGMNMLRVGGTMVYESDDVLRRSATSSASSSGRTSCSPTWTIRSTTPPSPPTVEAEATQQLRPAAAIARRSPSSAAAARSSSRRRCSACRAQQWAQRVLRAARCPRLCAAAARRTSPYCPPRRRAAATLPFHVDAGIAHYYGVGAYLRPLADGARRADVRFTLRVPRLRQRARADATMRPAAAGRRRRRTIRAGRRACRATRRRLGLRGRPRPLPAPALRRRPRRRCAARTRERYLAMSRVVTRRGDAARRSPSGARPARLRRRARLVPARPRGPAPAGASSTARAARRRRTGILKRAWSPVLAVAITDEGLDGLSYRTS